MAPNFTRQLLVLSLPTLAVLLSYFWFKKKRIGARSDPGITDDTPDSARESIEKEEKEEVPGEPSTPVKGFSRSLSGVETTPIDIVLPPRLRASRSSPIVISDEDLDVEIEKIKSMRSGPLFGSKPETPSPPQITATTPEKTPPACVEENNNKKAPKNKKNKKKMAQKDMAVVEEKLNSMKLSKNNNGKDTSFKKDKNKKKNNNNNVEEEHNTERELQRQSSERDSANHSPSDAMLASPTLSSISDNHSEVRSFALHVELRIRQFIC